MEQKIKDGYFDENGRHYFTEEEKQALEQLRDCLMQSYKEFWEEQDRKEQKSLEKNGDEN